jgi:hypothetical protein
VSYRGWMNSMRGSWRPEVSLHMRSGCTVRLGRRTVAGTGRGWYALCAGRRGA